MKTKYLLRLFGQLRMLAITTSLLLVASVATSKAASGSWSVDADGPWSTTANWTGGTVADGANNTATFANDVTAARTVTLDADHSLGNLLFGDADTNTAGGWIIGGASIITLNNATAPLITVSNSANTANGNVGPNDARINTPIAGSGFIKKGLGTLALGGVNSVSACQLDEGTVIIAAVGALGSQEVRYNGGGIRVFSGGSAFANTNRVLTTGYMTSIDGNYDAINGPWVGSGTMYINSNGRLTIGGGTATIFTNFTGTIDLSNSPANEIRINLGNGPAPYHMSGMTLNAGTNAGRFDFRTAFSPAVIRIGALMGDGANSKLESSEQGAGTSLTWEIGYLNTSTTFGGILRNRNGDVTRVGHLTKVGTGKLTLTGISAYTGNTLVSNGVLALSLGGTLGTATPTITVGSSGIFDVSGLTSEFAIATATRTLAGSGVVTGNVTVTSGTIAPGSTVGTLSFSNNLTLGGTSTATNRFDITAPGNNDKILIAGDLNLSGTVVVRTAPTGATIAGGTYTLFKWNGNLVGDTNNLLLDFPPQTGTLTLEQNLTTKEIYLNVSGVAGAANLVWRGDGANNDWDTATQNWRNSGNPSVFANGDNATFNDTGSNNVPVNFTSAMNPSSTIVNAVNNYTFSTTGSGRLTGSGSLVKTNTGKLTLTTDNDTSGAITNYSGIIEVGNGGTTGALGTSSVTVNSNATVVFNRSDTPTSAANFSGAGAVVQNGVGTLTLSGVNTHTGGVIVSNGTLVAANASGLGAGAIVLAGGTLSAASITINNPLNVTSNSTINNTAGEIQFASASHSGNAGTTLTLAGTAIRFTTASFTINSDIINNLTASLRAYNPNGTQTFNGVISGTGGYQRRWPDSNIANDGTTIFNGANTFSGGTMLREGSIGFGSSTVSTTPPTIDSGPIGTGALNQDVATYTAVFASGAARTVGNLINLNATGQALIIKGGFDLTLSGTMDLAGATKVLQVDNTAKSILTGDVNNGALVKTGNGTLYINGNNNASSTIVSNGALGGTGIINGPVTVVTGGTLAPGASVGTLTINSDLTLAGGNLAIEVNKSLSPSNDIVTVSGALANTGTGTLTVANLGPALAVGNKFTLFNKPLTGGGTLTVTGGGATWNNNLAVDGSITVATLGAPPPPKIISTAFTPGSLVFNVSNGVPNGTFYVRSSTNITTALTNWVFESTNNFTGAGTLSVTNPVIPATPRKFYTIQLQ